MGEPVSKGARAAFVAIAGRPSAGKSTLMNAICRHKIAITSPTPQTTRNRIRGIANRERGQLIFIDTPGFHDSTRTLNRHMRGLIDETIRECEIVLYVVDASRPIGAEEHLLARSIANVHAPVVVAINKSDIARAGGQESEEFVRATLPDAQAFVVSATRKSGLEQLVDALFDRAPEGEPPYPDDYYTDQPPEFRIAEIIREKAIDGLRQELPHAIYVDVADFEITEEAGREKLWIRAFLMVERESQKGMLVGKGGERIKRTRQTAQKELATIFSYPIHLDLRVKVDANWRTNAATLQKLVT